MGEVVRRTSGVSWGDFVRRRIFAPLGMTSSYTSNADFVARVGNPGETKNIMHPAVRKGGIVSNSSWDDVGTSENSALWSTHHDYEGTQYERFQAMLDRIYEDFTEKVAAGSDLDLDRVR